MEPLPPLLNLSKRLNNSKRRARSTDESDLDKIKLEDYSSNHKTLLDLILGGNADTIRKFLAHNPQVNLGDKVYTSLLIRCAIEHHRDCALAVLLENGAEIGGALFAAVREGTKECVAKILPYCNKDLGDVGPEDIKAGSFLSPLMMAVQFEEFEVVEFLVSKGYEVKDPKDYQTEDSREMYVNIKNHCDEEDGRTTGSLEMRSSRGSKERDFLLRVNSYRALAHPIYISYSYIYDKLDVHPLFHVFQLNETLLQQARLDQEFKADYKDLSEGCEKYAVDLLDQCHTVDELKILTDVMPEIDDSYKSSEKKYIKVFTKDAEELTVLNLALRNTNDKLVAHPYSQLRLNMVLYRGVYRIFNFEPEWRDRGDLSRVLFAMRHILLLPFLALIHIIAPTSRISDAISNPVVKFMSHTASFYVFVLLLILSSFQDMYDNNVTSPTIVEWIIFVWVIGLLFQEVRELFIQGLHRYVQQWWNVTAMIMVVLFLFSFLLRLVAFGITGNWAVLDPLTGFSPNTWYRVTLLANSLFSVAMVLSFVRLSGVFQVNDILGPLQLSLYRLLIDVIKFLVFFLLIFMAFGFSLRRLYSHYISTQKYIAKNEAAKKTSTNSTKAETNHHFSDVGAGLYSLFWSMFGLTDLTSFKTKDNNFTITKETGEVLFAFFQVLAVIVAVNMLIAMMTRSFDNIASDADMQWKVSRTRLWMNWVNKGSGSLPPPFNLIPNPFLIIRGFQQLLCCGQCGCRCCKCSQESRSKEYNADNGNEGIAMDHMSKGTLGRTEIDSQRRETIKRILKRYLHMKKYEDWREEADLLRNIQDTQEQICNDMKGDITSKL